VNVSAVEILWEEYLPAYAITIEPLAKTGEEEEEEEEEGLQALRSKMASLLKDAQEDGLTSLLNKKNFEEEVVKRLAVDSRGALIFIDLDGFKQVNDTFGHLMGDMVLKNSAERIRLSFRKDDIIGRYGGDEFVAYLPTFNNKEMLEQRLSALKNLLRHQHTLGETTSAITASIGVALFSTEGQDFNELVSMADLALYEAKRRGKDQHVYYSEVAHHKGQHSNNT
jgi:diguanylate cyclase (GGDEF)-like protein